MMISVHIIPRHIQYMYLQVEFTIYVLLVKFKNNKMHRIQVCYSMNLNRNIFKTQSKPHQDKTHFYTPANQYLPLTQDNYSSNFF